jgi:hypothetical protein
MLANQGKRKFQTGKEAKKAAKSMIAEKEALQKALLNDEEQKKNDAFLAEYKEKRGPSLMDAHFESLSKKPKTSNTKNTSFDYERVR